MTQFEVSRIICDSPKVRQTFADLIQPYNIVHFDSSDIWMNVSSHESKGKLSLLDYTVTIDKTGEVIVWGYFPGEKNSGEYTRIGIVCNSGPKEDYEREK